MFATLGRLDGPLLPVSFCCCILSLSPAHRITAIIRGKEWLGG
jgi:hypothetical protein